MAGSKTPFAIRTLERRPDGLLGVVYKDAATGEVITNVTGYQIIDPNNSEESLKDLDLDLKEDDKDVETTADQVKGTIDLHKGDRNNNQSTTGSGSNTGRNQSDNFGYIDKPTGLGLAAAVAPAGFGMALGMVDKGINVNNTMATNSARESMGLPGLGMGGALKGALSGNKSGYISDVNIGGQQYATGFEAQDRFGRSTLTPDEARTRGLLAGGIEESTKAQTKDSISAFKDEYGKVKGNTIAGGLAGNISEMANNVKGFFSGLFGGDDTASEMSRGAFPDAPSDTKERSQTTLGGFLGYDGDTDTSASTGGYSANGGMDSPSESARGNSDKGASSSNNGNKSAGAESRSDGWT